MDSLQAILSICGAVSIVGGAGGVIWKLVLPAIRLTKRVENLEDHDKKDFEKLQTFEQQQKAQTKCLIALLNHQITGNGIEEMKHIRDELTNSIIEQ